jgi:protoporphyrinogen IX oxidase
MTYLILKALHLVAIFLFLGGMLVLTLSLSAHFKGYLNEETRQQIQRWDRFVTSPALGLVWILGLSLATMGDWFTDTWLHVKFAIVFLLSGLHGTVSGKLKKNDPASGNSRMVGYSLTGLLVAVPCVIFLAVLKPWL